MDLLTAKAEKFIRIGEYLSLIHILSAGRGLLDSGVSGQNEELLPGKIVSSYATGNRDIENSFIMFRVCDIIKDI